MYLLPDNMAGRTKIVKPKKEEPKNGVCRQCARAYLMQSAPYNPVVAECERTKERWVASMNPGCGVFVQRTGEEIIHPMKHLNQK